MKMEDEEGFDFEWDIKQENGMNVTENKLFDAMKAIGLNPEPQYQISKMRVDFAFPDEKIAIEVNGPHHQEEEQKIRDKRRYFILKNRGWKLKTFSANQVYNFPEQVAKKIAGLVGHDKEDEKYLAYPSHAYESIGDYKLPRIYRFPTDYEDVFSRPNKRKKTNIWFWIILILLVCGLILYPKIKDRGEIRNNADLPTTIPPAVCTTDTKQCLDGSYVSRVAPICNFATCLPLPDYKVEGTMKEVVIRNNLAESISLNVTYRIFSNWFGKDSIENQVFEVGANTSQSFLVYNNGGCVYNNGGKTLDCAVSIINEKRIE